MAAPVCLAPPRSTSLYLAPQFRLEGSQLILQMILYSSQIALAWHYIGCFYFGSCLSDYPNHTCLLSPDDQPTGACLRAAISHQVHDLAVSNGQNVTASRLSAVTADAYYHAARRVPLSVGLDPNATAWPDFPDAYTGCFRACMNEWAVTVSITGEAFKMQYLQALFWSIMITVGVGRDVIPRTELQTAFSIFAITVGVVMYATIIGALTARIQDSGFEDKQFRRKIQNISTFMDNNQVPMHLRESIISYYEYKMVSSKKGGETDLLDLPVDLLVRLRVSINKDKLVNVSAFNGCPSACIISVIQVLQPKIGLPNEQLLHAGDVGDCFYIIENGRAITSISRGGSGGGSGGGCGGGASAGNLMSAPPHNPRLDSVGDRLASMKAGAAAGNSKKLFSAVEKLIRKQRDDKSRTNRPVEGIAGVADGRWEEVFAKVRKLQNGRGSEASGLVVTQHLSDGDTFGHSALVRGRHRHDVHAMTYMNLLLLHADKLDVLAREFEPLRRNIKDLAKNSVLAAAAVDKGTRKRLSVFQASRKNDPGKSDAGESGGSRGTSGIKWKTTVPRGRRATTGSGIGSFALDGSFVLDGGVGRAFSDITESFAESVAADGGDCAGG